MKKVLFVLVTSLLLGLLSAINAYSQATITSTIERTVANPIGKNGGQVISIKITFADEILATDTLAGGTITTAELTATGGATVQGIRKESRRVFTATLTSGAASTDIVISLAAGAGTTTAGGSTKATSFTIERDTNDPTVTISRQDGLSISSTLATGTIVPINIVFNEEMASPTYVINQASFTLGGVAGGSIAGIQRVSRLKYTATWTLGPTVGNNEISLKVGQITDVAGNLNVVSNTLSITTIAGPVVVSDTTKPTVVVSRQDGLSSTLATGTIVPINIVFSEDTKPVVLTSASFTLGGVAGGRIAGIQRVSRLKYTATWTLGPTVGANTILLKADQVTDLAGNLSLVSNTLSITTIPNPMTVTDTASPTAVISRQDGLGGRLPAGSVVPINIVFNEETASPTYDIQGSFTLTGGGSLSSIERVSSSKYTALWTLGSSAGANEVFLKAGQITDVAGNGNIKSNTLSITGTRDSAKEIRVFYSSGGTYTASGYLTITAKFITQLSGTQTPQITIRQQGTARNVENEDMTATADPNTWQYFYFVESDNRSTYVDGLATITISNIFNVSNAPIAGKPSDIDGGTFMIDTQAAEVVLVQQGTDITKLGDFELLGSQSLGQGTHVFRFTFNEEIKSRPKIKIDQQGTSTNDNLSSFVEVSGTNTFYYVYTVNEDNDKDYRDGAAFIYLHTALDKAGNGSTPLTNNKFVINTASPAATATFDRNLILARDETRFLNINLDFNGIPVNKSTLNVVLFTGTDIIVSGTLPGSFTQSRVNFSDGDTKATVQMVIPSADEFSKFVPAKTATPSLSATITVRSTSGVYGTVTLRNQLEIDMDKPEITNIRLLTNNDAGVTQAIVGNIATLTSSFDQPVTRITYEVAEFAQVVTSQLGTTAIVLPTSLAPDKVVATHTFRQVDPTGLVRVKIIVSDFNGNLSETERTTNVDLRKTGIPVPNLNMFTAGSKRFTGSIPNPAAGTTQYQKYAKVGDIVTVRMAIDELAVNKQASRATQVEFSIAGKVVTAIAYTDNTFTVPQTAPFKSRYWQGTYTVTSSSKNGPVTFTAAITKDEIGRKGDVLTDLATGNAPVIIDTTDPVQGLVESKSSNPEDRVAKEKDVITTNVTVNESTFRTTAGVQATAVMKINRGGTVNYIPVAVTGTDNDRKLTFQYTVTAADAGDADFDLYVNDLASNSIVVTQKDLTRGEAVLIDNEGPKVATWTLANDNSFVDVFFTDDNGAKKGIAFSRDRKAVPQSVFTATLTVFTANPLQSATSATVTSLTQAGGVVNLAGGEGVIRVQLKIGGIANGTEELTLMIATDTYDFVGNARSAEKVIKLTLNDRRAADNRLPVLANSGSVTTINDEDTANPFSRLMINDRNETHSDTRYTDFTATITLLENKVNAEPTDDLGILSTDTNGFLKIAEGTYAIQATNMASIQAALRALVYNPTDNRVLPGKTETTIFNLMIDDGIGSITDATNKVISRSVNNPHTLTSKSYTIDENSPKGTVVGTLYDTTDPSFADGIISDPDVGTGQSYAVTFTFGNNNNAFSVKRTRTVEGEILQLVVETPSAVDFESQSFFTIGITVTDKENPGLYNPSTLLMVSVRDLDDSLSGIVASVSKEALTTEVTTYPVPASQELNVKISSSYRGKVRLTLSNLSGKSVQSVEFEQSTDVSETTLDLSQLPSGVYLLQIITEEGITTKQVIKE